MSSIYLVETRDQVIVLGQSRVSTFSRESGKSKKWGPSFFDIIYGGLQFNDPCTFWIICPWRSSSCFAKSLLKMFEKRVGNVFKRKKSVKIYFLHFFNDNKKPGKRAEAKNSFDFFQDCSLGFLMNRFLASESPMNSSHLEKAREI